MVFEANGQNFKADVLDSDLPVLIEFTADWCPPCKMLAPIVHSIAEKYEGKLRVGMLDSDANPELTQHYTVMGLPTLLLFAGGKVVERMVGFTTGDRIEAKLAPHITLENA